MSKPAEPRWKVLSDEHGQILSFRFSDIRLSRDETKQLIRDLTKALSEGPHG